jgi:hypothetical protein
MAQALGADGATSQAMHILQALLAWIAPTQLPLLVREVQRVAMRLELANGNLIPIQRWASARPQNCEDLPLLH